MLTSIKRYVSSSVAIYFSFLRVCLSVLSLPSIRLLLMLNPRSRRSSRQRNRQRRVASPDAFGRDVHRGSLSRTPSPVRDRSSAAGVAPTPPTFGGGAGPPPSGRTPSSLRSAGRSVGNQVGGSGGGSPGKFPGLSKSILLSEEELESRCGGKIGNWGVCVQPLSGPNKCGFKAHRKNKVPLSGGAWYIRGQNRRDKSSQVVFQEPYLLDSEITPTCRLVLETDEKSTEAWKLFFPRPENVRGFEFLASSDDDSSLSVVSQGSFDTLGSFSVLASGVDLVGDVTAPLEFVHPVSATTLEHAVSENRTILTDIVDKSVSNLQDYTSDIEEQVSKSQTIIRANLMRLNNNIRTLTNRTSCLETDAGDVDTLPDGMTSLTDAINQLAKEVSLVSDQSDADFGEALDKLDREVARLERMIDDRSQELWVKAESMFASADDSSPTSSTHADQADVSNSFRVDGQLFTLEGLCRLLKQHEAKISSVEDALNAKGGVMIGGEHVASEPALKLFLLNHACTGEEIGGLVDCCSLACHESEEMKDSDKSSAAKAFLKLGYSEVDMTVVKSCQDKTIPAYCGSAKATSQGVLIDCFSSDQRWEGSGGQDGRSTEIIQSLMIAKENVSVYAADHFVDDDMKNIAKALALASLEFHTHLHKYFNDTMLKLSQRGMSSKNIRSLLSNQYHLIMQDINAIRRKAHYLSNKHVTKIDRMTRVVWVTLKTHQKMDEYLKYSFEHHLLITSSYVRFLTDNFASVKPSGGHDEKMWKKALDDYKRSYDERISKLESELKSTKDQLSLILKYHPDLLKPKKK